MDGFDCSGLVLEFLETAGIGPGKDMTAQGIFDFYHEKPGIYERVVTEASARYGGKAIRFGDLAFYGERRVTHVAWCLDNYYCIEAGGGGSTTHDEEDAARQNAWVRLRPIRRRRDLICVLSTANLLEYK